MFSALFNSLTIKRWIGIIAIIMIVVGVGYYYLGTGTNENFTGRIIGPRLNPGAAADLPGGNSDAGTSTPTADTGAGDGAANGGGGALGGIQIIGANTGDAPAADAPTGNADAGTSTPPAADANPNTGTVGMGFPLANLHVVGQDAPIMAADSGNTAQDNLKGGFNLDNLRNQQNVPLIPTASVSFSVQPNPARLPIGSETLTDVFNFAVTLQNSAALTGAKVSFSPQPQVAAAGIIDPRDVEAKLYVKEGNAQPRLVSQAVRGALQGNQGTLNFTNLLQELNVTDSVHTFTFIVKARLLTNAQADMSNHAMQLLMIQPSDITFANANTVVNFDNHTLGSPFIGETQANADMRNAVLDGFNGAANDNTPVLHEVSDAGQLRESGVLPAGNETSTEVFRVRITPSRDTILDQVRISTDNTVLSPISTARLHVQLFLQERGAANPTQISELTSQNARNNGQFDFSELNQVLNIPEQQSPLIGRDYFDLIAKITIDADAQAVAGDKNFKLTIADDGDIRFLPNTHRVNWRDVLKGNVMSVHDAGPAQGNGAGAGNAGADAGNAGADAGNAGNAGADAGNAGADAGNAGADAGNAGAGNNVVDLCPNIDGPQDMIPLGKTLNVASGDCVDVVAVDFPPVNDSCAANQIVDAAGNCADLPLGDSGNTPPPPPAAGLDCTSFGLFSYEGPARPGLIAHQCIPCPSDTFILTNQTCVAPSPSPDSGGIQKKEDQNNEPKVKKEDPNLDQNLGNDSNGLIDRAHNAAFEDVTGNSFNASPNLYDSQRLVRAPERGQTGPDSLIYILTGVLTPASVGAYRSLKGKWFKK